MRAKNRKHHKVHIPQLPHPEPTIRELAERAVSLFNYGGDKSHYLAFLKRYHVDKQKLIISEMQQVWRSL